MQKSDGAWTYFASDVAYHKNKVDRKFDYLINILGADHAGYIKRISSSVEALSGKKDKVICKISQLVKLIKDNKPFKMSKRKGDYITVDDLIEEVGKDATRFIMLNRSSDVELDFDFDAVKEKSKDNPLYYVQYCYARISSVFRHIDKDLNSDIKINNYNFQYSEDEINILKKMGGEIEISNVTLKDGEQVGDITSKSSTLSAIDIDEASIPSLIDEIPILSLACTLAEGESTISGADELRFKESDRIKSIVTELKKFGCNINETENGIRIVGKEGLLAANCDSHGDHRIAMMAAIAGTKASGDTTIKNIECVSISFPNFFELLRGFEKK